MALINDPHGRKITRFRVKAKQKARFPCFHLALISPLPAGKKYFLISP
jgi:hypothetical protein